MGCFSQSQKGRPWTMNGTRSTELPPLQAIVFAMSVPAEILARFRAEFPLIRFILPGEEASGEIDYTSAPTPTEDDVRDADGLIGWGIDAEVLAAARNLRWVHASGAGVERYDLKELAK